MHCADKLKDSTTLYAVFAEVSKNINPFSLANSSPSSYDTCLLSSKSFLFPINITVIVLELLFLTSSSHFVTWIKVSLLVMSYTNKAPMAPL
jgi:hypothetical protein